MIILKGDSIDFNKLKNAANKMENDPSYNTFYIEEAGVEIQTVPLYGFIIIYTKSVENLHFSDFVTQWNQADEKIDIESNVYLNKSLIPFGYIRSKNLREQELINANELEIPSLLNIMSTNNYFKWYIKIIQRGMKGHICCSNLYNYIDTYSMYRNSAGEEAYLLSAASTIVYDTVDLFKTEIRQLDFPYIDQYTYSKNDKIIKDNIHFNCGTAKHKKSSYTSDKFSNYTTISLEIIKYYLNNFNMYKGGFNVDNHIVYLGLSHFMGSDANILNLFTYDEEILFANDEKYKDDTCFISGSPLFGKCLKIDLEYKIKGKQIKKYIIVQELFVIHNADSNLFVKYNGVTLYGKAIVMSLIRSRFNLKSTVEIKTEYTVLNFDISNTINIINNMNIQQNKKNLFSGILLNGYYIDHIQNNPREILYVINLDTNQIFVGLTYIKDVDIMTYTNSSSVLFTYNTF